MTLFNVKKNDYYYSFKTQFEGQLGQDLGHASGGLTKVNQRQYKDKKCYYIVLKPDSGVDRGKARVIDREDQHELTKVSILIENSYYHSSKTQLARRPDARLRSQISRVNSQYFLKIIKATLF